MAKNFFSHLKKSFLRSPQRRTGRYGAYYASQGFTLVELLVVTAIAGIIVAGLTFIVIQMMTSDQREASRSETQREMQLALNYMSSELQEAIYVYPGTYLEDSKSEDLNTTDIPFANYLPASVTNGAVPVLAFWKLQPFPDVVKQRCAATNAATNPVGVACLNGQSYALVVYSLARKPANPTVWKGQARITRYVLSQFDSSGNLTPGYVDPSVNNNLASWPWADPGTGAVNLQATRPTGSSFTLVDFVSLDIINTPTIKPTDNFCPAGGATGTTTTGSYDISPKTPVKNSLNKDTRTFYACVFSQTQTTGTGTVTATRVDPTQYRDVVLFLRGSALGRPGMRRVDDKEEITKNDQDVLPTLETRVLTRSVLGRRPTAD